MDKPQQRRLAHAARDAQADKDAVSAEICRTVISQAWYADADTILWYLHCRSEVRTLPAVAAQLAGGKRIAVPYCTVDALGNKCLGLWHLRALDELRPGMWNILEPPKARWREADKCIKPAELDAVIVPGVAFDSVGGRLGNGAGYYDRLLSAVRADAVLAGVCYASQLLPAIEMQSHDVYMNLVVTESNLFSGKRPLS